ncbi:hypothetical protein UPYG_G00299530 [Umbra pygmaea]|uniref:Uncharacterized protein n=1 Tax=Umbra pygmaea TaxID=75934 RepID=A0ABD0WAU1_UMBPY
MFSPLVLTLVSLFFASLLTETTSTNPTVSSSISPISSISISSTLTPSTTNKPAIIICLIILVLLLTVSLVIFYRRKRNKEQETSISHIEINKLGSPGDGCSEEINEHSQQLKSFAAVTIIDARGSHGDGCYEEINNAHNSQSHLLQ